MSTPSPVVTNLVRQFLALAPLSLSFKGKNYNRAAMHVVVDDKTARFDFNGKKQRGAFLADKVSITVIYDRGADLYNTKIETFDGKTLEVATVHTLEGVDFEMFENVGEWLRYTEMRAEAV